MTATTSSAKQRKRDKETKARLYAERREWLQATKIGRGCDRCGYNTCAAALHYHHLDPSTKVRSVGLMMSYSEKSILMEMAKCELLCANCHAEEEWS
jgi:hypothetical protein